MAAKSGPDVVWVHGEKYVKIGSLCAAAAHEDLVQESLQIMAAIKHKKGSGLQAFSGAVAYIIGVVADEIP